MSRLFVSGLRCLFISLGLAGMVLGEDGGGGGNKGGGSAPPSLSGAVEKIPASGLIGTWTVSKQSVIVTSATKIVQTNGPVSIGSCVLVYQTAPVYYGSGASAGEIDVISAAGGCTAAPGEDHREL